MRKETVLLTTVWHTGTKYFREGLRRHYHVNAQHIHRGIKLDGYHKIYTTYRDPLRVAASWANRGHFHKANPELNHRKWVRQWSAYRELLEKEPVILDFSKGPIQDSIDFGLSPINSFGDVNNMHKALDDGDTKELYKLIPKKHIDYAFECCKRLDK